MASQFSAQQLADAKSMRSTRFDPKKKVEQNYRLELPFSAYQHLDPGKNGPAANLPKRQNFNTLGKKVMIGVNQFKVLNWPDDTIAQFDIKITHGSGNIDAARINDGLTKVLWNCKPVNEYKAKYKSLWIFDDSRIAWNKVHMPINQYGEREHTVRVDLDALKGQEGRGDENQWNVTFRQTTTVKMSAIKGFLDQKMDFTNDVFEAINFLDHVLRQTPLEKYVQVKRSFYAWDDTKSPQQQVNTDRIDSSVDFMRGVYASMRLCHRSGTATGLAVNIDVANGLFWKPLKLIDMVTNWFTIHHKGQGGRSDIPFLVGKLRPVPNAKKQYEFSELFKDLRKLCKLRVRVKHNKANGELYDEVHVIKRFHMDPIHLTAMGANAKNTTFELKKQGPNKDQKVEVNVFKYMQDKHNVDIQHWQLPLIETFKAGSFPMEFCTIMPQQRYPYKTTPDQTSQMIKAAVKRPNERIEHINHGLRMLKWEDDKYLKNFNITIDPTMTQSEARVLQNPEIMFGGGKKMNPRTTGRWNIGGTKFLKTNTTPLTCWGIGVIGDCVDKACTQNFMKKFVETYVSHGGNIPNKNPVMLTQGKDDIPTFISRLRDAIMRQGQAYPQIIMLVLPTSDSQLYGRLKKNLECRWGVLSQFVRREKILAPQDQYCSNVCMKFNAKLGGATNMVAGKEKDGSFNFFGKKRTMIVGADVTHPAHGSKQASMAAVSMSADKGAQRYWANCQTNGVRTEMISPMNMNEIFIGLVPGWVEKVGMGQGPEHIYYFRDGVSEGQYQQVLDQEVASMKKSLVVRYPGAKVLFTVVVCSKRHKIRFFPKKGDPAAADRNQNPVPGVLVERDVTHPFENDFYLCSHSAIQGTARPTHYHVILDEANVPTNQLHQMIYHHCYQYIRSTTPVSLYPAVYYAHLAAARCRAHENVPSNTPPRYGQKHEEYKQDKTLADLRNPKKIYADMNEQEKAEHDQAEQDDSTTEVLPLTKFASGVEEDGGFHRKHLKHSMWYI